MNDKKYYLASITYSDAFRSKTKRADKKALGLALPYHGLKENLEQHIKEEFPDCYYSIEEIDQEIFRNCFGD